MTSSPAKKIGLLAALYFSQGLPFGFQATALPVYLRESGVSLTSIGFLGALSLPWLLKIFWAPLVDRFGSATFGRRRSWIVPAQIGLAASCAAASFVSVETLGVLLALVFLMNLCAATQDIAVDGLAVDLLSERELGMGNAAQVVGYKLGMLTGGGLLVWASDRIGFSGLFLAMAALVSAILAVSLTFTEPHSERTRAKRSMREVFSSLWQAARLPGTGWLLVFVATYKLGETMVDVMFKPFLVDAGFSAGTIGLWVGTWGMVFSLAGSFTSGVIASARVKRGGDLLRLLFIAAALRVLPMVGEWGLAAYGVSEAGVILVTCAEHFFGGALTTVMFAFMMSRVDRTIGATHYTLLASIEVLGKLPASALSGPIAEAFGYAPLFAVGVAASIAYLALWFPMSKER